MGTPFVNFLEPSKLEGYRPGEPSEKQPQSIPQVFVDAMEVRHQVFVGEQGVPADNEFDPDDARSCHWVVYASVNKTVVAEARDSDENVLQSRQRAASNVPVGTIRLVPFPHEPHPKPNGKYWLGVLQEDQEGDGAKGADAPLPAGDYTQDRPTIFHDGKEPYIKLGRLAVVKDFRGNRLAGLLMKTVINWLKENPSYFDPSVKEPGLEQMGAVEDAQVSQWRGLVCVHAQLHVVEAYKKWGFQVDQEMGTWWEEGIEHVGMIRRLIIENKKANI